MLPYDGSPDGNALGMQYDEDRQKFYQQMTETSLEGTDAPRTPLQFITFGIGVCVFLLVFLYGTVG